MKIPVFLSMPSLINSNQQSQLEIIEKVLLDNHLEPRTLGRTDYPTDCPLKEVLSIAKHCAGGVILGFSQFETSNGTWKPGTTQEQSFIDTRVAFPSPWNNLEAGILYGLGLPLMIFRESHVRGGIFDPGVTDVYIHEMPTELTEAISIVFLKWACAVRQKYYN